MACASCGAENPAGNKFCGECGAALALACSACGSRNPPTSRFCGECGARLTDEQRAAASPSAAPTRDTAAGTARAAQAPAPGSYVPRHLADRILASRAELEGERKQVTVLFADVVGSTELIQDLDPEEARALLEPAVGAMIGAIHRFDGTVCRVMGDGIMALFGAPIAHEDHAARACYAALTMQDSIRAYGEDARARAGVELNARVGLNSGEVVVGSISNDLYVEYSAIGPTTHLAARMEQLAVPGTVRLTANTARLVDGLVEVRSLGKIPVRGLAEPIEAFELIGAGPSRRRFQAAAARGLTPFVGRQAELDALQRALDLARTGHGQVVAPVGEPGVGKSRLLYEFVHSQRTRDWLVLESGSVSYGKATSYLPAIDLLKGYCRIESRDDARAVREKLTGKLLALDAALAAILPPLLALLDLPVDDEAWAGLDPAGRRRATLDALRRLLLRESQEQTLLLVFEDLHWIDAETQALLDGLVEALPTARLLLLVNYRPEYTHTWGNKSYYTQLRIDPLGQASAEELLTALLGDPSASPGQASLEPLKALLIGRTDGNPFFLEESVRTLVETGTLVGERGAYRQTGPVESVRVPATVQAVLAARIDRLPPEDKRLLQTASVIGKDVPFALLQAIADTPDAELQAGLSRLQAAELLYAVSLFPELELTFKHALTHEVAYGGLLQERRRALHARIVVAIETLYADRLDEHVERLASHALRGQLWEKAVTYSRQAGARALGRSLIAEAVSHLEQALVALENLAESPEKSGQAIDIRFELRTAFLGMNEYAHSYEHLQQAEALAVAAGDERRLGWVSAYLAYHLRAMVDHRRGVETGERAIAIADLLGDLRMRSSAIDAVAQSYHEMGQLPRAIELLRMNIDALANAHRHDLLGQHFIPMVNSLSVLAWCRSWQGVFSEAIDRAEESLRVAEAANVPLSIGSACFAAGLVHTLKGDPLRAVPLIERSIAIARSLGREPHPAPKAFLGFAFSTDGRSEEAVTMLEQSLTDAAAIKFRPCTSLWTGWLAGAYLQSGRIDDARQTAARAVEMGRAHHELGFEGYALRELGDALAAGDSPDFCRAEGQYLHALAIAEELGMRPLQAHTHLSLGKLHRRAGRPHEARAELNVAIDLYLSMEMTHWIPEAEAELAALGQ
jgi:class 3 adenylate cyclase/tetratricopeptide (TPR) repeat protein